MKTSPIQFSPDMIRAIRAGRKTQTRRLFKLPKDRGEWEPTTFGGPGLKDKHGKEHPEKPAIWNTTTGTTISGPNNIGDELWVKETYGILKAGGGLIYRADGGWAEAGNVREILEGGRWKSPRYMSREQSRVRLEITAHTRIQRLQDITEEDARAEGHPESSHDGHTCYEGMCREWFAVLWDDINKEPGTRWEDNPWVWVYTFRVK